MPSTRPEDQQVFSFAIFFLITLGIIGTQGEFIRLLKKLQDIKILSPVNVANVLFLVFPF
jgi:hypothetical protein